LIKYIESMRFAQATERPDGWWFDGLVAGTTEVVGSPSLLGDKVY
jgi:hypothetical protein